MIALIGLFIVSLASGIFLCTRVYLLIVRRELNVKGAVYSLATTPFRYWSTLFFAVSGTAITACLALVTGVGLTVGWR
jgi:hypothetical protein